MLWVNFHPRWEMTLNEGRDISPGDTGFLQFVYGYDTNAQRRPGHQPRRHRIRFAAPVSRRAAQRRPGHQPRRHRRQRVEPSALDQRSTKAGTSAPATHPALADGWQVRVTAQRRPGHQPRRHMQRGEMDFASCKRAQRRPGHQPRRHTTARLRECDRPATLNEGRDISPGDTTPAGSELMFRTIAQRRPGHQPRRHLSLATHWPLGRCAQRRPGHQPRRHAVQGDVAAGDQDRSTKAGTSAPATRPDPQHRLAKRTPLNEGRDISPGDTAAGCMRMETPRARSTKAGTSAPATPLMLQKGQY